MTHHCKLQDEMNTAAAVDSPTSDAADECIQKRRILVLSGVFPTAAYPNHAVFVKNRVRAVADLSGYEVRVVSPVPRFPPIKWLKRWYLWSQFPKEEVLDGLQVSRTRYFQLPKIGGYFSSELMFGAIRRRVEQIRKTFDFDLIDAHWAYPAGVVAARLGHLYRKPLVVTGRGEDMCRFPDYPLIGRRIRHALRQATQCIGVSREIARAMVANGARADRVHVIPNGVDCKTFRPLSQPEARRKLDLPPDAKVIVSVGDRFQNKGFHLLVDAVARMRRKFPNVLAVIVGGAPRTGVDFLPEIQRRIQQGDMQRHVRIVGRRPHEELVWWYNAADAYALFSEREGSPNVLLEALACGTPCVATPVGGIPDELADTNLGVLLGERSAEAAADGLTEALTRPWDRQAIRRAMEARTWHHTATQVADVFDRALEIHGQGKQVTSRQ
ncbi:MAG: glycosyltransferase family 4 protein [Candidatus Nealsonbacteria bacterium]|nr:glycosyltransferase family 4 protein [Candidatus Nealsonbacteria bacterium]